MKLTTKNNHVVEIKDIVTRKDQRIMNEPLNGIELSMNEDGKPNMGKMTFADTQKLEDAKINAMVVKIDDSSESILDRMLALENKDFDEVMDAINKVVESDKKK